MLTERLTPSVFSSMSANRSHKMARPSRNLPLTCATSMKSNPKCRRCISPSVKTAVRQGCCARGPQSRVLSSRGGACAWGCALPLFTTLLGTSRPPVVHAAFRRRTQGLWPMFGVRSRPQVSNMSPSQLSRLQSWLGDRALILSEVGSSKPQQNFQAMNLHHPKACQKLSCKTPEGAYSQILRISRPQPQNPQPGHAIIPGTQRRWGEKATAQSSVG